MNAWATLRGRGQLCHSSGVWQPTQFGIARGRVGAENSAVALRVLIAPDKFKGTLSAAAAARAIARGWKRTRPGDCLELFPISDGGDGFGEVLGRLLGARRRRTRTVNAAGEPCRAPWWWAARSQTAVVESAGVVGLAMLPRGRFHPFALDTRGLGRVLRAVAARGARDCILGIGGSATNDGGFGLARALGWRFLDRTGRELERWTDLERLARLVPPLGPRLFRSLMVAVDVRNPLLGARGATRVYGPQKGLRRGDYPRAERCLRRLALVGRRFCGRALAAQPGAGAAGGLGFGLALFLGARLAPGFELLAQRGALERRLRRTDLVITGEGAMDRSTLMGKGVGELAVRCQQRGIPCLALAGTVVRSAELARRFTAVHALTDVTSHAAAQTRAAFWLERLAQQAARGYPVAA